MGDVAALVNDVQPAQKIIDDMVNGAKVHLTKGYGDIVTKAKL